ncbi:MAG TPA: hypothetical protein V6D07_18615 [Trichocoleus sp.]
MVTASANANGGTTRAGKKSKKGADLVLAIQKHPDKPDVLKVSDIDQDNFAVEFWAPVSWVYPNVEQPRTIFPESTIRERADSLIANGQRTAIDVMFRRLSREEYESQEYESRRHLIPHPDQWEEESYPCLQIKNGECRFRGTHMAGKEVIRVKLTPLLEGAALLAEATADNLERQQMTAMDEARSVYRLVNKYGMTADQVAKHFGWTKGQANILVEWRLGLMNLSPKWMQVADEGGFWVEVTLPNSEPRMSFIEIGGDRLRVASQMGSYGGKKGEFVPDHDMQDTVLVEMMAHAARKGTTWTVTRMKKIVTHLKEETKEPTGFDLVQPRSPATQALVTETSKNLRQAISILIKVYQGQKQGSPSRCIEFFGETEAQGMVELLQLIEKGVPELREQFESRIAKAFISRAREEEEPPTLEELLSQGLG